MASSSTAEMKSQRKGTVKNHGPNHEHARQDELSGVVEATPPTENRRLAHRGKESGLNSLLEDKCLATWKTGELSLATLRTDQLINPPHLQVLPTPESVLMMEWVLCPPQVHEERAREVHSFPTKSLVVATYQSVTSGYAHLNESYKLMRVVSYFSKYGHQLTSLILFKLTLAPKTVQNMLAATPQLKALAFDGVRVGGKRWQSRRGRPWITPSNSSLLPKLEHMRILDTKTTENTTQYWQTLFDWILDPYTKQLVTLDLDGTHGLFSTFQLQPFPLLRRFSVWNLGYFLPSLHHAFPKVESVYIGQFRLDRDFHSRSLEWQSGLTPLANRLIELHLDILRNTSDEMDELWTLFRYQETAEEWLGQRKWSVKNVVFSKLKTFAVLYPKYSGEVETLKDMLGCMPNLEELILLRFKPEVKDGQEATEDDTSTAKEHVLHEKYRMVCPKLKKITVRMVVCSKNVVYNKIWSQ